MGETFFLLFLKSHNPSRALTIVLYIHVGSEPIIGLLLTCSAWSEQVAHFGKKPDHAVLAIDNRGIGNSELSSAKAASLLTPAGSWVVLLNLNLMGNA
jgi:hypothetical protein